MDRHKFQLIKTLKQYIVSKKNNKRSIVEEKLLHYASNPHALYSDYYYYSENGITDN